MKNTRPYKAGENLANAITEMVHLMYQNETAEKFLKGLTSNLLKEMERRKYDTSKRH